LITTDTFRGEAVANAAKKGHDAVHGTDAQKRAKWQRIYDDYKNEIAKGTPKAAAASIVAHRHKVSERKVYRVRKFFSKID
jgi:RNA polymerase-interacting CarD/CdnL/TRCF family regulator